jgi:hypothetical protein
MTALRPDLKVMLALLATYAWHRCGGYVVLYIVDTMYPPGLCRVV